MGRELMRVPLDFDWPLGEIWEGYLNPYWKYRQECPSCKGSGYNPKTLEIYLDFYGNGMTGGWLGRITQDEVEALQANNRIRWWDGSKPEGERCSHWDGLSCDLVNMVNMSGNLSQAPEEIQQRAIQLVQEEAKRLNVPVKAVAGNLQYLVHDGINRVILIETRAKRMGVWGLCPNCVDGDLWSPMIREDGVTVPPDDVRRLYDDWTKVGPPKGEGYQLWETTSEGSPSSPVFDNLDDLCQWCETNATTFGSFTTTAEKWKEMLSGGIVLHKQGNAVFM